MTARAVKSVVRGGIQGGESRLGNQSQRLEALFMHFVFWVYILIDGERYHA